MTQRKKRPGIEQLAAHLKGRDVRALVRGSLDGKTYWVLFGPGDAGGYRVDNYRWRPRRNAWAPGGDSFDSGQDENSGWDMLGILFVRAFTAAT